MLLVEEEAVFPIENAGARGPTNEISDRVSTNRGEGQRWNERVYVEESLGSEETGRDEQRIAGQEDSDQQPRFGENDRSDAENSRPLDQLGKVRHAVEEVCQRLHRSDLESENGRETCKFTAPAAQSNHWRVVALVSGTSASRPTSP